MVEVDGSTIDARWLDLADVESGVVPTVPMVLEALAQHRPVTRQRLAAYALVVRGDDVLLTRNSVRGPRPGHVDAARRGRRPRGEPDRRRGAGGGRGDRARRHPVGELLGVHDEHFTGTAPSGVEEDFHGVHLVFTAEVAGGDPAVHEHEGTTDAAAWIAVADVESGAVPVAAVVTAALEMGRSSLDLAHGQLSRSSPTEHPA